MANMTTQTQVSAGGVAYRSADSHIEVALISVKNGKRWQLPKGMVDNGETHEQAAQREVREEAGITTELDDLIDKIEYWYVAKNGGKPIRFHKFVYFYLMQYCSGSVSDHDHEVDEARWVPIERAGDMLSFKSEKEVLERARLMIRERTAQNSD